MLDAMLFDVLVKCIPEDASYEVLPIRKKAQLLNKISLSFFWLLPTQLFLKKWSLRSFEIAFLIALIKSYNPKIIITYTDNSKLFKRLSPHLPECTFISLQNGTRWDLPSYSSARYFGNYYSFGSCESDILANSIHEFDSITPIGSVRLGVFLEQLRPQLKVDRICVISQLSSSKSNDQTSLDYVYEEAERSLFRFVDEYAFKNRIKIVIAARGENGSALFSRERAFFQDNAKSTVVVMPRVTIFSSYELAYFSSLVVTISSSLGYEMLGAGKKVMFAKDFEGPARIISQYGWARNFMTYRLPDELRLQDNLKEDVSNKIDYIFNMTNDNYNYLIKEAKAYYMNLNKERLPHKIICNDISAILHRVSR